MTKNKTEIKDTIFIYSSKLVAKIKSLVKPVAKLITNKKIRETLIYLYNKSAEHTYKKCILKYYGAMDPSKIDAEKKEIIDYLQSNPATLLSYEFIKKYKNLDIKVFDDEEKKLKYVFLDNKRLYFTKKYNDEQIKGNFWALLAEQDINPCTDIWQIILMCQKMILSQISVLLKVIFH